jgi:hypothetical protein
MTTRHAAFLLLLAAGPAVAHDYPIKPVAVELRVEPDRVVADVDSDSIYWIEEVIGLHPMPPRDWPADARARAEKYADEHLRLTVDGKPLPGRLSEASYVQRPWEVNEEGRVRLRLVFPPVADGATLDGAMDFFEDYRQERLASKEAILPFMDFRGRLSVPGRVPHRFELAPGSYAFSVSAADARRTPAARFVESLRVGALSALDSIEGWAALAALALSLAPGVPSRRRAALLFAAAAVGAAPWPGSGGAALEWTAGAIAAVAAGRWLGASAAPWLEAVALAALTRAWSLQSFPFLPLAAPGPLERCGAALGQQAAAAAALAAGIALASADRRAMDAHSASRASELFDRRRRLAATALLLVCGYGLSTALAR